MSGIYMNNSRYIVGAFFVLIGVCLHRAANFNRQFLVVLLAGRNGKPGYLAIAYWYRTLSKKQNLAKLEQTNARPSRAIFILQQQVGLICCWKYLA